MKYLEMKKRAFMSIVNAVKGFVRTVSGVPPITLSDCVDNDSLISYSISGNSIQNGEPTPENPVEIESVGDYDEETGKYKIPILCGKSLDYVKYKKGYFINSSGVEEARAGYTCTEDYIPVLPNTTYRIICKGALATAYFFTVPFYDENKEFLSRISLGAFDISPKIREFITPENCYYIRYSMYINISDVSLYNLDNAINIYLDEPLGLGEVLKYPKDNIPKLPTTKGTTIYSIETAVQPTNMSAKYYSTSKGE